MMRIKGWKNKVEKQHVFIIGSKGIPANYGGYETFVEHLTGQQHDMNIKYHVACKVMSLQKKCQRFNYNGADCFNVYVPHIGPAQAIYYDIVSLKDSIDFVKTNRINHPIFYILACRIGPFMHGLVRQIHKIGGKVFVNPDGHEWLRAKWSYPIRKYWKFSEKLMVKNADLLVCDSQNIEKYIQENYRKYSPKTIYIAYGAKLNRSHLKIDDSKVVNWFKQKKVELNKYYLIVGRFVPENNYETMIREFMISSTRKDLVIISNVQQNKFFNKLEKDTGFKNDSRVKFVGTVYDADLLKFIRENAFAYIHGHEVGGTNPSLLEALSSTKVNLLLDVGFNKEVAKTSALYWNKERNSLSNLIDKVEAKNATFRDKLDAESTDRIKSAFTWEKIVNDYETIFENPNKYSN